MKVFFLSIALLLTLATVWPVGADMDSKQPNVGETGKGQSDKSIGYLGISGELASVARDNKDPILMLAAARLQSLAATEAAPKDKTTQSKAETDDNEKSKPPKASLYAMAEEYAGSNVALLTLIDESKSSVRMKGHTRGAAIHEDRIRARDTDTYVLNFDGGRTAELAVLGDGDTDLDLYVYDENANLVCKDTDMTDQTYCRWNPRWDGPFRIEVKNRGDLYNRYTLLTN